MPGLLKILETESLVEAAMMSDMRPAAVAGLFYPRDPIELQHLIQRFLTDREAPDKSHAGTESPLARPHALIVPHAGYLYSGHVAGLVYRHLRHFAGDFRRVLLLGPAHRVFLRGIAVPRWRRFGWPGGDVPLDAEGIELVRACPGVIESNEAHALEHALEVQLPFLSAVLKPFSLVPLVVGEASPSMVASVIETLIGDDRTLVVISSDLSHYHEAQEARRLDRDTADHILNLRYDLRGDQACGCYSINGLLSVAKERGWQPELIALENSGDTAGTPDRVVGYGGFVFH